MSENIASYLSSKGLNPKVANSSNIHLPCFFCGEDSNKRGRLYISTEEGNPFQCFLCGEAGNIRKIKEHFGDQVDDESTPQKYDWAVRAEIFKSANDYYVRCLNREARGYLASRGLTDESIEKFKLGYAAGGRAVTDHLLKSFSPDEIKATYLVKENNVSIQDYLYDMITIPYITYGTNIESIRGRSLRDDSTGRKYQSLPKAKTALYNTDALFKEDDTVIITEGEFDAMALDQLGFVSVGVPGAQIWKPEHAELFKDFKRVFVFFDHDEAGEKGAAKLLSSIKRSIRVEQPGSGKSDPSDLLASGWDRDKFDALFLKSRKKITLLATPREAREELEEISNLDGLQIGFEKIDELIKPGILPGQVAVTLAKSGSGKTLSLINIFENITMADPNAKILFCSLEQTKGEWFERAQRIHNFNNLTIRPEHAADEAERYWKDRIRIIDKNRLREDELVQAIEDFEDELGSKPSLIAIDYLGYWAAGFQGKDRYEKTSNAVMALKGLAKEAMVPIWAPHQVSRAAEIGAKFDADAARDSGVVAETADFIFSMWAPDSQRSKSFEERDGIVKVRIEKSRHGGRGAEIDLHFAPLTLAMVSQFKRKQVALAKDELEMQIKNMTWQEAIYSHRHGNNIDYSF